MRVVKSIEEMEQILGVKYGADVSVSDTAYWDGDMWDTCGEEVEPYKNRDEPGFRWKLLDSDWIYLDDWTKDSKPPVVKCETCAHWMDQRRSDAVGLCRRYPPVPFTKDIERWPRTHESECCGEWKETPK